MLCFALVWFVSVGLGSFRWVLVHLLRDDYDDVDGDGGDGDDDDGQCVEQHETGVMVSEMVVNVAAWTSINRSLNRETIAAVDHTNGTSYTNNSSSTAVADTNKVEPRDVQISIHSTTATAAYLPQHMSEAEAGLGWLARCMH